MKTEILTSTKENILKCAEFLKEDGVLVCPTETVYGLVANAFSKEAVEKVFEIKNRPKTKALSCNISSSKMFFKLTNCESLVLKKLTEYCNFPLVVPSANVSGFKSKTNVLEVYEELKGKVKFMLDGKETHFKKESTIIEIKGENFKILRQGAIEKEEILNILF